MCAITARPIQPAEPTDQLNNTSSAEAVVAPVINLQAVNPRAINPRAVNPPEFDYRTVDALRAPVRQNHKEQNDF